MQPLFRPDRLWKQELELVVPVPSIPLGEAQPLRESAKEPPPSIRRPRRIQEDLERTPHKNLRPFQRQQGTASLHLSFLRPACLNALFSVPDGMSTFGFPA